MKLLLLSTHITGGAFEDVTKPKNGIEARQYAWLKILKKKGIDTHVVCTGKIDPRVQHLATFHSVHEKSRNEILEERGSAEAKRFSRLVAERYVKVSKEIGADVCWSNSSTSTIPKKVSAFVPTVHMLSILSPSPLFFGKLVRDCEEIVANGGRVFASPWMKAKHFELSIEQGVTTNPSFITDEADVYTTMDQKIWEMDVKPQDGNVLMVGRCDPSKQFSKMTKTGIPFTAYVSGAEHPKILDNLRKAQHVIMWHNESRQNLLNTFQTAATCLLMNPFESLGLIAIETLLFGSIPITFVKDKSRSHSADHYVNQVTDLGVEPVAYNDPNWVDDLKSKIEHVSNISFEDRQNIASSARNHFSEDSWFTEFENVLKRAKLNTGNLDIF